MTQGQMNRKHMLDTTLAYLEENTNKWQSIAKVVEVKTKLADISDSIESSVEQQEESKLAVGKMKVSLKRTIAQKADVLNDLVEVFATMNGNEELAMRMSDSESSLFNMKNDDMLRAVKIIIEATVENKQVLISDYGLLEEQITDLQADYDRFVDINGRPQENRVKSKIATLELEELFTQFTDLLNNQLDNLMKIFKARDVSLYNGYLSARVIVG